MIRKLPAMRERVESGPTQFGDDWPGIFIRGDEALFMASYLDQALAHIPIEQVGFPIKRMLEGLRDTLQSCRVGDTGWPPG